MNCFAMVWMTVLIAGVFNWGSLFWFNTDKTWRKLLCHITNRFNIDRHGRNTNRHGRNTTNRLSIDLYDNNFLQFLSVLNQKTEIKLKTLAIKTVIHTTTKQFIFIFQKSNSLNNVVFLLFKSFGYINWRNNTACGILWEVMMCLLHHSLWHESWPTMFRMKVDKYKRCVGNF